MSEAVASAQAASWQTLALRIDAALPQTQCTRCGYPDCAAYASAIAQGSAAINQCPPGGQEGIERLAAITGQPAQALNAENGTEGLRTLAFIEEDWCIGCTLCIKACPTDAIIGTHKWMHSVITAHCTGCELCIPVCPVDCITLTPTDTNATGWAAWSSAQAQHAQQRYQQRQQRLAPVQATSGSTSTSEPEPSAALPDLPNSAPLLQRNDKRAAIAAALAKARAQRQQ